MKRQTQFFGALSLRTPTVVAAVMQHDRVLCMTAASLILALLCCLAKTVQLCKCVA